MLARDNYVVRHGTASSPGWPSEREWFRSYEDMYVKRSEFGKGMMLTTSSGSNTTSH
jgi:hypothetical protein